MIQIYSDPHIGKNLISHTTSESRKRLRDYIALHTSQVVDDFDPSDMIVCAGDFFDTHSNSEDVLYSAMWAASRTSAILAGNHDVVNIADRKGTLDIIGTVFDMRVVPCRFGKINYRISTPALPSQCNLFLVPHHSSQALFEEALDYVANEASDKHRGGKLNILITHCNYDSPFVNDDVALNMTSRKAKHLLSSFDYIFLGHEHNHRTDHEGNLIVIGSPHPTGFGDISDKYIVSLDETGECRPILKQVWCKNSHYLECDWRDLIGMIHADHQFVKVTGEVSSSEIHSLAATIRRAWRDFTPFAIKSDVKVLSGDASAAAFDTRNSVRINEIIERELKGSPDLYELWKEITNGT